jgi:hypothetical protein
LGVNAELLIDAIVRQTTVLIAEIATATEIRPQLAHTADDVFRSLVTALRSQGVTNKAIADMFGLTLRTYHNRVARLAEGEAERGEQLRQAIYKFIEERKSVRKAQILEQFHAHEPVLVAGLLRDLVAAELVFQSGSGQATAYRIAHSEELPPPEASDEGRLGRLFWIAIQRFGPIDIERLVRLVPASAEAARAVVDYLISEGKVHAARNADGTLVYSSDECFISPEDPAGWEAAVFDHFQALVGTLAARLRLRAKDPDDWIGGGTFSFEVWRGHPLFEEAVSLLAQTRSRSRALRERIREYNAQHSQKDDRPVRVLFYFGQSVIGLEEEEDPRQAL